MKIASILGILVAVFSITASAEDTFSITTVDGQTVQVRGYEIEKTYNEYIHASEMNKKVTNDDGSISIMNPMFKYAGRYIYLQGDNGTNQESVNNLIGVCKHFGLGKFLAVESAWTSDPVLLLNKDGFASATSNYQEKIKATSVTCKAK